MPKPAHFFVTMLITVMMGLLLVISYWLFYPYRPQIYVQPYQILNENHTVKAGEAIKWRIQLQNLMAVPINATQEIVGSDPEKACDYKILKASATSTTLGVIDRVNDMNIVPEGFKPCVYHVVITVRAHVNPIRDIVIIKRTEDFTVVQ